MPTYLQPPPVDYDALEPFLDGDVNGEKWQEEMAELARRAAIDAAAEQLLMSWDVQRRAKELDTERSGVHNGWTPVDLEDLFDTEQIEPTVGEFINSDTSNGGGVFYAGKVNEIHGPSESGKTMVVLAVAAQEIRAGNHVAMVDFEDDGRSIINRLRFVFGLERAEIVKQFHYYHPDSAFNDDALNSIADIESLSMVVIDAVTEGMSIAGLDGRNENEVAQWYNVFPKKIARLGPAVVLVDHTTHDRTDRQIGSQHKKSAVDGVSYTAEPVAPFVKGGRGQLRIKVAKDKPGGVRPMALPQGEGKQFWRGDFRIDGRGSVAQPRVELFGVDPQLFEIKDSQVEGKARDVTDVFIPPPSQLVVLEILAESNEWMSAQSIMEWHNDQLEPKDPRRMGRTDPRKLAVKLIQRGLAERRDGSGSVAYRVTADGRHSVNAAANERAKGLQSPLPDPSETGD